MSQTAIQNETLLNCVLCFKTSTHMKSATGNLDEGEKADKDQGL